VILAIELLLFEFKARSFIPLVIASTLATAIHIQLMGPGPMFDVGSHDFGIPRALPFYLLLGLLCGLAAVGLSKLLYLVEDLFEKLPFDDMWWPAVGALGLGIIGYFVPRVLGVGYDTIGDILTDRLAISVLLAVMIFKTLALVISLGSGTSGGLLAPTFMASAAMGSLFAIAVNRLVPGAHLSPAAFALVAMGAVFGAAARATFTFIIFAFEITRDYNAVLPLMLVCVIADGIAILLQPHTSIMTEKLARRGLKILAEFEPDVLKQVTVADAMNRDVPTIPAGMPVRELAGLMSAGHPLARHYALPIVDAEGKLAGIITRKDVVKRLELEPESAATVLESGTPDPVVCYPDEVLHEAVERMLKQEVGRLPVVSREDPKRLVGYLGRAGVMAARMRRLEEEHVREPGWWQRTTA
jgi:CBS domain-containing protein